MNIRITWFFIIWLALAACIAAFLGAQNLSKFYEIASDGSSGAGKITKTDCTDHSSVRYEFSVTDQVYVGVDASTACASLKPGDDTLVYFSITEPKINMLAEPWARLWAEVAAIALACLLLPPLAAWAIFLRR